MIKLFIIVYGVTMDYKKYIAQKLNVEGMQTDEIAEAIMIPPTTEMGD